MTDGVYYWDDIYKEHKGFGLKRKYLFGSSTTFKYVVIKAHLVDAKSLHKVGTVTKIKQSVIHAFPKEKLYELDREKFKIFKYGFDSLIEGAINKILIEMEI